MVRVLPAIEQRGTGCPCPEGLITLREKVRRYRFRVEMWRAVGGIVLIFTVVSLLSSGGRLRRAIQK